MLEIFPQSMSKSSRRIAKRAGVLAFAILLFLAVAGPVLAQANLGLTQEVGSSIGLGTQDIRVTVARIIQVFIGILGIILVVILAYGGFLWMTAGGEQEKVDKAVKFIRNGVIGLVIILTSYAVTAFIVSKLLGATGQGTGGAGYEQGIIKGFGDFGTASLGEGIIQAHYPPPGATGVARNAKIIVTFKVPIDPATIVSSGKMNLSNVRLAETRNLAAGGAFETSSELIIADVNAYATADNRTFVFAPAQYLGSPTETVSYTVSLGPGVKQFDGSDAFAGSYAVGYHWEFETGTSVDTVPPRVVSIYPRVGARNLPRNSVIQVNFSEAVDPVVATGVLAASSAFRNLTVDVGGNIVDGTWEIGNQYKTVEFRSAVKAGQNSCGNDIFVLPGDASLDIAVKAATVGSEPPAAALPYPFDGVSDVAGNSLDGDGDGTAEGPEKDTVAWNFTTSSVIDTTPPRIVGLSPEADSGNADLGAPVLMSFSKPLSIVTVSNRTISFTSSPTLPLWYYLEADNLGATGEPVASFDEIVTGTRARIEHERLAPTVGACEGGVRRGQCAADSDCPGGGRCIATGFNYYPDANSGVQDINQNCFLPTCGSNASLPYCCPVKAVDGSVNEVSCSKPCAPGAGGRLECPR